MATVEPILATGAASVRNVVARHAVIFGTGRSSPSEW
jgi:hypothetical protein